MWAHRYALAGPAPPAPCPWQHGREKGDPHPRARRSLCLSDYAIRAAADQRLPPLLPAVGALKKSQRPSLSWSSGTGTRSGVTGEGVNVWPLSTHVEVSTFPFLCVSPGGARNSSFLLLRDSVLVHACLRVCRWVHKITACSLHPLSSGRSELFAPPSLVWQRWDGGAISVHNVLLSPSQAFILVNGLHTHTFLIIFQGLKPVNGSSRGLSVN